MALVMFEGFNRADDWDPTIWFFNGRIDDNAVGAEYVKFGTAGLVGFNDPANTRWLHLKRDGQNNSPAASALAMFPQPQAPTGSTVFNATITDAVYIGFRVGSGNMLGTGPNDQDSKYWSIWSPTNVICTIELKGTEYLDSPPTPADLSKLTLRFKQNNVVVAEFNIPNSVMPISQTSFGRKIGGAAYLNDGHCYFEFGFNFTNNTVMVFLNGMQLLTPAGATTATVTLPAIAGWEFHTPQYTVSSIYIDDFYVVNSNVTDPITGGGPNGFLGYRTKVLSPNAGNFIPREPASPSEYLSAWTGHETPSRLHTDDGDASIISSNTPGAVADYSFPITTTNNYIGGVRLKTVARYEGAYAIGSIQFRYRYAANIPGQEYGAVNMGSPFLLTPYYRTYRSPFYGINKFLNVPNGGLNWDPTDFMNESNKGFGIKYV